MGNPSFVALDLKHVLTPWLPHLRQWLGRTTPYEPAVSEIPSPAHAERHLIFLEVRLSALHVMYVLNSLAWRRMHQDCAEYRLCTHYAADILSGCMDCFSRNCMCGVHASACCKQHQLLVEMFVLHSF